MEVKFDFHPAPWKRLFDFQGEAAAQLAGELHAPTPPPAGVRAMARMQAGQISGRTVAPLPKNAPARPQQQPQQPQQPDQDDDQEQLDQEQLDQGQQQPGPQFRGGYVGGRTEKLAASLSGPIGGALFSAFLQALVAALAQTFGTTPQQAQAAMRHFSESDQGNGG